MQIVIDVNDELAEYFANHNNMSDDGWFSHSSQLLNAFRSGVPLGKIKNDIEHMDFDFGDRHDHTDEIIEMVLDVISKYETEIEPQDKEYDEG